MAVEMNEQIKKAYQILQAPFYQGLGTNPAVELIVENTETSTKKAGNEQQKLASQRPRGTRIDDTGTRLQVKGGRNYTSRKLFIGRDELYDDVVVRGLRADGLSTKLGVKNHKDSIAQLLSSLFQADPRLPVVEEHFRTQRQKSNCAKTMFATMTNDELQFLKAETFPSRIDVQVRDYLTNTFNLEPEKLKNAVEVLEQIQQVFKLYTPYAEFLSNHNFQTRGFFLDIILMTCSFLMQIIQRDDGGNHDTVAKAVEIENKLRECGMIPRDIAEKSGAENKTAAEILLSVGTDILDNSNANMAQTSLLGSSSKSSQGTNQKEGKSMPTTVVVEEEQKAEGLDNFQWTTVEVLDGSGNSRFVLLKTGNEDLNSISTVKILDMLQNQGMCLEESGESGADNEAVTLKKTTSDKEETPEDEDKTDELTLLLDSEQTSTKITHSTEGEVVELPAENNQRSVDSPNIDVEDTTHEETSTTNIDVELVKNDQLNLDTTEQEHKGSNDSQKRKLKVMLPALPTKRQRK